MKNFYYLLITFLIFSVNAFPQITIKEKVKIKPQAEVDSSIRLMKSSVVDELILSFDADLYIWDWDVGQVTMISPINKEIICLDPMYSGTFSKGSIIKLTSINNVWDRQVIDLVFKPYSPGDSTYFLMFSSTDTIHAVGTINIVHTKKPKLVILLPTKDSPPDTISAEPKMPNVVCKAQLKNYNKGQVTFEWNYIVTNKFERYNRIKGEKIALCPRIDTTKFIGMSHSYNEEIAEWTVPFIKDSATFYYKGITHRHNGCEKIITMWDGANEVFTGGNVYIEVTAKDELGKTIKSIGVIGNTIIGSNPAPAEVRDGLTLQEQVIVYMESYPKWEQFNETNRNEYNQSGNPIYGYPNGFGLMQIDTPPATEVQLWNWRENIEAGKQLLDEKYSIANNIYLNIKNKYPDVQNYNNTELLKQTFQLYNGGKYYDWIPENAKDKNSSGKWIKSTNRTYGATAWKIYSEVISNNFPSDW